MAEKLARTTFATLGQFLDFVSTAADEAIAEDDLKSAGRLLNVGVTAAKTSKKEDWIGNRLKLRLKSVESIAKALKDAEGNMEATARIQCFRTGIWEKGLPGLAKSKDEDLMAVAQKDLSKPTKPQDRIDLGDAWYELAEKTKDDDRIGMLRRAYHWWRLGLGGVSGLVKAKVEIRMAKAFQEVDAADAKAGSFALWPGKWACSYAGDHPSWNYKVSPNGQIVIFNSKDRDGRTGVIVRSNGLVMFVWENGDVLEVVRPSAGGLSIQRYRRQDYPKKYIATATAAYQGE